jgi:hypothetical protein
VTNNSKKQEAERMNSDFEEILARVDSLPILDSRTPDEILGYDDLGLPR